MREIQVNTQTKKYSLKIGNGVFDEESSYIALKDRKSVIVADSNVAPLYGEKLMEKLRSMGIEAELYVFPAGESSKSHEELIKLYNFLSDANITRNDYIIAVGGGVTGDLAGFAASTYLRGVNLVQVPTSLLAMVDSSIGGKVAVNLPAGKNLVGSFYQPDVVLIDPSLLCSLPDRHFSDGMAEVVKYGCIRDSELFSMLETMNNRKEIMQNIEEIIFRCCVVKKDVVEQDEKEKGLRMILNFGHTFGHAIEKCFYYKTYTHGEAVAMGMVFISEMSCKLGFCQTGIVERIKNLLAKFCLPVNFPDLSAEDVYNAVIKDKKARTNLINLVLIEDIGKVRIEAFSKEKIGGIVYEMLGN
ncbi:3-dehydroquinate synthase AroB [Thermoclostridium stercorarium subsp. stercorarium DSM 8532]|uniref:3-dehydroquinate synthase n=2 Tax=Thermoclostridium stercorarium TaxID=1510 RepID=L7VRT9_THES1|nr:3-dehydroquinate synthase [Thermoclostridium stercorarium]AGC68283.1 3-dehydroquinate synthase AroB [Thermoclostridium stercorarium subsp. stercorarium DSM 8532]AGI39312.1 3-dehydroquinate synthase [Thermoclostridium stercorarium subsp. stercorarium DSM 8532]ANW98640.1 3-dehydroquinate synthase [Thermoclostridium stercorarium subsp. thermolacticum DSM 2910]